MLITFLVLFGLIDVIYNPMRHILGMSNESDCTGNRDSQGLGNCIQPIFAADRNHLFGTGKS